MTAATTSPVKSDLVVPLEPDVKSQAFAMPMALGTKIVGHK